VDRLPVIPRSPSTPASPDRAATMLCKLRCRRGTRPLARALNLSTDAPRSAPPGTGGTPCSLHYEPPVHVYIYASLPVPVPSPGRPLCGSQAAPASNRPSYPLPCLSTSHSVRLEVFPVSFCPQNVCVGVLSRCYTGVTTYGLSMRCVHVITLNQTVLPFLNTFLL
jgi:hypothetical protein